MRKHFTGQLFVLTGVNDFYGYRWPFSALQNHWRKLDYFRSGAEYEKK
jgi:hypothetical protein